SPARGGPAHGERLNDAGGGRPGVQGRGGEADALGLHRAGHGDHEGDGAGGRRGRLGRPALRRRAGVRHRLHGGVAADQRADGVGRPAPVRAAVAAAARRRQGRVRGPARGPAHRRGVPAEELWLQARTRAHLQGHGSHAGDAVEGARGVGRRAGDLRALVAVRHRELDAGAAAPEGRVFRGRAAEAWKASVPL
ncbi:hypothetical protein HK405_003321, partial [Cladochytrium tenue]